MTNIPGANVTGVVANANYAAYSGNVVISTQSNITQLGVQLSFESNGNVIFANSNLVNIGNVANLRIAGGANTQFLQTYGNGVVRWATPEVPVDFTPGFLLMGS